MARRRALAAGTAALVLVAGCSQPSAPSADRSPQPSQDAAAGDAPADGSSAPQPAVPDEGGEAGADATPAADPGWGPSAEQVARARRIVGRLTLPERAGQTIVAQYAGTTAPTDLVDRLHLGGVVAFTENITSADQIRSVNRTLQRSVRERGYPLTIGVDQEGGIVERFTAGTRFPTFMTAGAADRPGLTRQVSAASGAELADVGFTTDYAPVADVTIGAADPTIGARSPGGRPGLVAEHAVAAARGYADSGVMTALKHFPGHGSVTTDSHLGLPRQTRSLPRLRAEDWRPFRAGVAAGLSTVMVGHIDVRAVDPGVPSSLSRELVTGKLRGELGFPGLVTTDALNMQAVADRYSSAQVAVRALRAGVDVLLMPTSPEAARDGIVAAVRQGRLSAKRLNQAATRHVALLLHQRAEGTTTKPPGSSAGVAARWSTQAITSVAGRCRGRLVGDQVAVTGPATAVGHFRRAAEDAGLAVGASGTTVRLVGYGGAGTSGDVVVALDAPHVLGRSSAPVKLATYGETRGAMRALVAVLTGRAEAPGELPVGVAGVPRRGC